jgi:hypothetical protein
VARVCDTPLEWFTYEGAEHVDHTGLGCDETDFDLFFEGPPAVEGEYYYPFGWGTGRFPDMDGDGREEFVIAEPGALREHEDPEAAEWHGILPPLINHIYYSRGFCETGTTFGYGSADMTVVSSDGVGLANYCPDAGNCGAGVYPFETLLHPIGDLDGDGLEEGVMADGDASLGAQMLVYSGAALATGGRLGAADALGGVYNAGARQIRVAVRDGDVDGDGVPDLLVENYADDSSEVDVVRCSGAALLGAHVALADCPARFPRGYLLANGPADIDGDGVTDVVMTSVDGRDDGAALQIWYGAGTASGIFVPGSQDVAVTDQAGSPANAPLLMDDLDGDGLPELLSHRSSPGEYTGVAVYRGRDLHGTVDGLSPWFSAPGVFAADTLSGSIEGSVIGPEDGRHLHEIRYPREIVAAGGVDDGTLAREALRIGPSDGVAGTAPDFDGDGALDRAVNFTRYSHPEETNPVGIWVYLFPAGAWESR